MFVKLVKKINNLIEILTKVSASRKTHLEYWVNFQQFIFVNVIPSSGLSKRAKFAASLLSKASTSMTASNVSDSSALP